MATKPFFSGNYGSSLGRVDTSSIVGAGRAQGQMFANLGKTIGSSIEKFRTEKEKKEQQQKYENLFVRQYESNPDNPIFLNLGIQSIEEAKAVAKDISKDPKLVADAMKFGQMAIDQQKAQLDAELFNLEKSEILRSRRDKDLAKSDERGIDLFMTTRPDLPITKDTPASSLPPLPSDPFAAPPTTFKGQAPAVAQLPKSFQLEGKKIIDAFQSGRLSPTQGNRIMNKIQTRATAERKAGPTRSEILAREKYENEKAIRESEKEILDTESANTLTDFYNETSGLLDKINEKAVDVTGPIEGTSVYRFFSKIGDTDDEQVRRRLEMFTRKLTLDAAQNLKGALSDKDIRFLVEQAPDMDDNPSVWKKYMGDLKTRLERNARQKGINFEDTNSPQQSANTIDPAELDRAVQAKRDLVQRRKLMSSQNEVGISPVN